MSGRRFIGIDLGTRRVGVAVSDPTGMLAFPLVQIAHPGDLAGLVDRLAELVQNEEADGIVIGDPRHASGDPSPGSERALALAQALGRRLELPVWLWNEWGSTAEAAARLGAARPATRARGLAASGAGYAATHRRRKEKLDRAAAAIILQDFLDASRDRALPPPVAT